MSFAQPAWLLLLLPLLALIGRGSRLLTVPRGLLYLLVVTALAGPVVHPRRPGGTVVLVADRSAGMPADAEARALETLQLLHAARPDHGRLAMVSFGREAAVDLIPGPSGLSAFATVVDPHASDLTAGLRTALGLIGEDGGRILLLSDGRYTETDPRALGPQAVRADVAVDYRLTARADGDDWAVTRLSAPTWVEEGQGFLLHARLSVPRAGPVHYRLLRRDTVIAEGTRELGAGEQLLGFRDLAAGAGTQAYRLDIVGGDSDQVPENNSARFLVGVRGKRPVLLVSPRPDGSLAALLQRSGLRVVAAAPETVAWSPALLSGYAAVILENVPAQALGRTGMSHLAAWVETLGGGLYVTGGPQAYGPGGYYKSLLEPVLPVSMELRREHRKFSMALVVAADRSGSMGAMVAEGVTKMDLAGEAAAEVVRMLSANDAFGMLAVDTEAHEVLPLTDVDNPGAMAARARAVEAGGGGIYVFEALTAAGRMLLPSQAGARHILLFADAADAEEPGDYRGLLARFGEAGITVSVVALGTPGDSDAALLAEIAALGGGQLYFTQNPMELPRIFAQDTFVMARSAFVEEPTAVVPGAGMRRFADLPTADWPALGGYNLCYAREGAETAVHTGDGYGAPVVASWYAGSGRVVCFTGEAAGTYSGAFGTWPSVGAFHASLAGWAAGTGGGLPEGALVTQEVRAGMLEVTLHLDPARAGVSFGGEAPRLEILRGDGRGTPEHHTVPLRFNGPDTLVARVALRGDHTVLGTVFAGEAQEPLAPVRLPYSPEYAPADGPRGETVLTDLARMTGGVPRARLESIWADLPDRRRALNLAPWLLLAAVAVLLLEVLQRRTGLVGAALQALRTRRPRRATAAPPPQKPHPAAAGKTVTRPAAAPAPAAPEAAPSEAKAAPAAPAGGLAAALGKARAEADKRLK